MMTGAVSALLSFSIFALNTLSVGGVKAKAKAMMLNIEEQPQSQDPEKMSAEMKCPNGFPRKSMDGCCRWTTPPKVCAKEKIGNMTTVQCMEKICSRGKGATWALKKDSPDASGIMNVCCNQQLLFQLQDYIKPDSGFSAPSKAIVTRGSMDDLGTTTTDNEWKEQSRNIALFLLVLTLGLFAVKMKVVDVSQLGMFQKKRAAPAQEFGLPSGSRSHAAPVYQEEPTRPVEKKTPEVEQSPLDAAKEPWVASFSADESSKKEFAPLCEL